jgi:hypothetical protein
MDVMPSRIAINVGVAEGATNVSTGKGVNVGVDMDCTGVDVGSGAVGVGKTSTVNVQARVHKVIDIRPIIDRRYLFCFIAFSLSAACSIAWE